MPGIASVAEHSAAFAKFPFRIVRYYSVRVIARCDAVISGTWRQMACSRKGTAGILPSGRSMHDGEGKICRKKRYAEERVSLRSWAEELTGPRPSLSGRGWGVSGYRCRKTVYEFVKRKFSSRFMVCNFFLFLSVV